MHWVKVVWRSVNMNTPWYNAASSGVRTKEQTKTQWPQSTWSKCHEKYMHNKFGVLNVDVLLQCYYWEKKNFNIICRNLLCSSFCYTLCQPNCLGPTYVFCQPYYFCIVPFWCTLGVCASQFILFSLTLHKKQNE